MDPDVAFAVWSGERARRVESVLERVLSADARWPAGLRQAMRYAVLGGGKRVRALLAYAAGELTGADPGAVDAPAAAVELIHAYSLVHDDLPCMDDDVLRRGNPTCHVAFGEATALLAGDALQSLAFEVISGMRDAAPQIALLARAAGAAGMAGGQAIDLASAGQRPTVDELEAMHALKTGALIRASVRLGAACGRALSEAEGAALDRYAAAIGLAFQVVDDVLDVHGGLAPAQHVVVHARQVVVHERVGVDQLDRRRRDLQPLCRRAAHFTRGEGEQRPHAFASAEHRVAHRFVEPMRRNVRLGEEARKRALHAGLEVAHPGLEARVTHSSPALLLNLREA